ncbi:hypothetical protein B0H12DRAFT_329549 [Mycena haematopus]|nr:hypothetical protein B0H12DRAFT_329549 [Mycena haematopus]
MTVAVYQGQNAEEEWRRDVNKYSGVRHPKFLQVYGVTGSSSLYATVFHDDLVSLQEIYWLCRRSSLATAYLDAYFVRCRGIYSFNHWNILAPRVVHAMDETLERPSVRRSLGQHS